MLHAQICFKYMLGRTREALNARHTIYGHPGRIFLCFNLKVGSIWGCARATARGEMAHP